MDVLCTNKTGTLTLDRVMLERLRRGSLSTSSGRFPACRFRSRRRRRAIPVADCGTVPWRAPREIATSALDRSRRWPDCNDGEADQGWMIEDRTKCVRQAVAKFPAFMD